MNAHFKHVFKYLLSENTKYIQYIYKLSIISTKLPINCISHPLSPYMLMLEKPKNSDPLLSNSPAFKILLKYKYISIFSEIYSMLL